MKQKNNRINGDVGKSSSISSVQALSRVQLFMTPWIAACQASLSITNIQSHSNSRPSSQWCHPATSSSDIPFSSCPQSLQASQSFSNESILHMRWPKYWSFSFSINPSNEHPGLISFRIDWLDLLAVQGTQESSPAPPFKSINSSALSFLHSPTFTTIHDQWKNHSLD